MERNIEKEEYAVSLLGYNINKVDDNTWHIKDNDEDVGYIKYDLICQNPNFSHIYCGYDYDYA